MNRKVKTQVFINIIIVVNNHGTFLLMKTSHGHSCFAANKIQTKRKRRWF